MKIYKMIKKLISKIHLITMIVLISGGLVLIPYYVSNKFGVFYGTMFIAFVLLVLVAHVISIGAVKLSNKFNKIK